MNRTFGLAIIVLGFALVIGAVPACAEGFAGGPAAPVAISVIDPVTAAPSDPGCAPALDLAAVLSSRSEVCPATTAPVVATPELKARPPFLRTCVCSCGYPCSTDADCGPGGRCGPGITCC